MRRLISALLSATLSLWSSGCGTVANFASGDPQIYGGVQKDLEWGERLMSSTTDAKSPLPQGDAGAVMAAFLLGLAAAEPVLSFACDTVTLPVVLCLQSPRPAGDGNAAPDRTQSAYSTATLAGE